MAGKPAPLVTEVSRPFWDGLKAGQIVLQHCCGSWIFYPRVICPRCGTPDPQWRHYHGTPVLYSFTVTHAPVSADFAEDGPIALAVVELAPGIHMPTTLVDEEHDRIRIGAELTPVFDAATFPDLTVLRFRMCDMDPDQAV